MFSQLIKILIKQKKNNILPKDVIFCAVIRTDQRS